MFTGIVPGGAIYARRELAKTGCFLSAAEQRFFDTAVNQVY
jgi:hypothetical protein